MAYTVTLVPGDGAASTTQHAEAICEKLG